MTTATGTTTLAAVAVPVSVLEPGPGDELAELEEISPNLAARTLSAGIRRAYAKAVAVLRRLLRRAWAGDPAGDPESVRWYVAWMSDQHDAAGLPRFSGGAVKG